MTTREHILANAFLGSERLRRSIISDRRCLLTLADYSRVERAKILYNHIYFSDMPREHRDALLDNNFYETILDHPNYNPRLIEWLSTFRRFKNIAASEFRDFVAGLLDAPEGIWREAFYNQVSASARSFLLFLFSAGGLRGAFRCEAGWRCLHELQSKRYNFPMSVESFTTTLRELEGSFIAIEARTIKFINPSVADFMTLVLSENSAFIDDLINAAIHPEQIFTMLNIAGKGENPDLKREIGNRVESAIGALARILLHDRQRLLDRGIHSIESAESIYINLIGIAENTRNVDLLAVIDHQYEIVKERAEDGDVEVAELVRVLTALSSAEWLKLQSRSYMQESLRQAALAGLASAEFFGDFLEVDAFRAIADPPFSEDEDQQFSETFLRYLDENLEDNLGDGSINLDELAGFSEFLEHVVPDYGFEVAEAKKKVDEAISDAEMRQEISGYERYEYTRESREARAADDVVITSMFDTLR